MKQPGKQKGYIMHIIQVGKKVGVTYNGILFLLPNTTDSQSCPPHSPSPHSSLPSSRVQVARESDAGQPEQKVYTRVHSQGG